MTIAVIEGQTEDTYLIDLIVGGLETLVKGFPADSVIVVTSNPTVKAMVEARHKWVQVIRKSEERPHICFMINPQTKRDLKIMKRCTELDTVCYVVKVW